LSDRDDIPESGGRDDIPESGARESGLAGISRVMRTARWPHSRRASEAHDTRGAAPRCDCSVFVYMYTCGVVGAVVMVVAIDQVFIYTVMEEGSLWAHFCGTGHGSRVDEFKGTTPRSRVVMVAVSVSHTACVMEDGALFTRHSDALTGEDGDKDTVGPWGNVPAVPSAVMVACGL